MDRFGLRLALENINEQAEKWKKAYREFGRAFERALVKCMYEAIANGMSIEQFAKESGLTTKAVRRLMRNNGLDPKNGKSFLAHAAAEALQQNAELLGIDPLQMDLTSPLAYLPMGSDLREALLSEAVKKGADLDEANSE